MIGTHPDCIVQRVNLGKNRLEINPFRFHYSLDFQLKASEIEPDSERIKDDFPLAGSNRSPRMRKTQSPPRRRNPAGQIPPSSPGPNQGRLDSIDALRGFDMFWIMGGDTLLPALLGLCGTSFCMGLSRQFEHSAWNGMTFYDLVFPLFLFIVGLSMPFSLEKRLARSRSKGPVILHLLKRSTVLILLGLLVNGLLDFQLNELRWAGVLQRIGLSYGAAGLLMLYTRTRTQVLIAAFILLAYWGLMACIPVPAAGAGILTPEGNLAGYVDRLFLPGSFCCYGAGDNEGILSTFPAVVSVLMGVFTGRWVRSRPKGLRTVRDLAAAGGLLVLAGWFWNLYFPVNKLIWSSSYVLVSGGWSLLLFTLFHWMIDVRGWRDWSFPFRVIGVNAIAIYVVQALFEFGILADTLTHGFIGHLGPYQAAFMAMIVILLKWLFLYHLYRQKLFLKV
jgi:predicted acyltransferase